MDMADRRTIALSEAHRPAALQLLSDGFPAEDSGLLEVEVSRGLDTRFGVGRIALDDDIAVGVVLARRVSVGSLFVVYLTVTQTYRRSGLARRLIGDVLACTGTETGNLLVNPSNRSAKRLYAQGGLRPRGDSARGEPELWTGRWKPRPGSPPSALLRSAPGDRNENTGGERWTAAHLTGSGNS